MTLPELIRDAEDTQRTLTVYGEAGDAAAVRKAFGTEHLRVERGTATGEPESFAVLSHDGRALIAVDLAALLPGGESAAEPLEEVVGHLEEAMFSSRDTRQMIATSREIEDRAWRVGAGSLHAGFQTIDALRAQRDTYRDLASGDLEVHAYVQPFEGRETPTGVTVHEADTEEIRRTWFVIFDGDGADADKCALLAEQRGRRRQFYGLWTYDPELVDAALAHLRRAYVGDSRTTGERDAR